METRAVPKLQILRPLGVKNDKNTQELANIAAKKGQTPEIPTGFHPGTLPSVENVPLEPLFHCPGTKNRDNSSKSVEMSQNALAGCQNVNKSAVESVPIRTVCESSDINYPESDKSGVQSYFVETAAPLDSKRTDTLDYGQIIPDTAEKAQINQTGPGIDSSTAENDFEFEMGPQYEAFDINYPAGGTTVGVQSAPYSETASSTAGPQDSKMGNMQDTTTNTQHISEKAQIIQNGTQNHFIAEVGTPLSLKRGTAVHHARVVGVEVIKGEESVQNPAGFVQIPAQKVQNTSKIVQKEPELVQKALFATPSPRDEPDTLHNLSNAAAMRTKIALPHSRTIKKGPSKSLELGLHMMTFDALLLPKVAHIEVVMLVQLLIMSLPEVIRIMAIGFLDPSFAHYDLWTDPRHLLYYYSLRVTLAIMCDSSLSLHGIYICLRVLYNTL